MFLKRMLASTFEQRHDEDIKERRMKAAESLGKPVNDPAQPFIGNMEYPPQLYGFFGFLRGNQGRSRNRRRHEGTRLAY
jgi:hypothetical protein